VTEPVLPTADQDIERFLALRDHIEAQNKAFTEWAKPLRDEMEQITSRMHARLLELGGDKPSIKTAAGTAFTTTTKNPKIENRDTYLEFVGKNWTQYGNAMLQLGAPQVSALQEFMDDHEGQLPPGVKIEPFTRVTIRKG
jgi:hypothetical protein